MLALIGVAGLLNKDQPVLVRGRHMAVQVTKELGRIPFREIVISTYQQGARVDNPFRLGEVSVFCRMDIVQKSGKLPVPGSIGGTDHPAHEREGKHFVTIAPAHLIVDHLLFPGCHTGHHIGQIRRGKQEKVLHPRIVMPGEIVDDFVGAQGVTGQDDVPVACLRREGEIGVDVFIRIGKPFIP